MSRERYLLDKSALARWPQQAVATVLDELSEMRRWRCGAVDIAVIHSARTAKDAQRARWLLGGFV